MRARSVYRRSAREISHANARQTHAHVRSRMALITARVAAARRAISKTLRRLVDQHAEPVRRARAVSPRKGHERRLPRVTMSYASARAQTRSAARRHFVAQTGRRRIDRQIELRAFQAVVRFGANRDREFCPRAR